MSKLSDFEYAYVICALWASSDDNDQPLDQNYDIDDLSPDAIASMQSDCRDFQQLCDAHDLAMQSDEQNGHDFWLTRNGHGAGFWDRGLGDAGKRLTDNAHSYGSSDLYVGDDGAIYVS
jgi:hypothetical protein